MKEYLKMADVFAEEVQPGRFVYALCAQKSKYAAHAINSHDELVAEVERLRGELSVVGSALNEVDRVISERVKNGAYDLDDISSEVSQAIERLNRDTD